MAPPEYVVISSRDVSEEWELENCDRFNARNYI
jgi:hypothetical protein